MFQRLGPHLKGWSSEGQWSLPLSGGTEEIYHFPPCSNDPWRRLNLPFFFAYRHFYRIVVKIVVTCAQSWPLERTSKSKSVQEKHPKSMASKKTVSLRIQVCPKKGINPTILLWGWDWDHQTYSREGYGSLGLVKRHHLMPHCALPSWQALIFIQMTTGGFWMAFFSWKCCSQQEKPWKKSY